MNKMYPQYSTVLFCEVYDSADDFLADYKAINMGGIGDESAKTLYYLLYSRFGNNPIANYDVNQFRFKVMSTIFMYGPTWEKKLDIQKKIRELSDEELTIGSKQIYNHAFNPSSEPGTGSLTELDYINDQNTTNIKRSKMDAYTQLWNLLETDVTNDFLGRFTNLFKKFVRPANTWLYETSDDDDEEATL